MTKQQLRSLALGDTIRSHCSGNEFTIARVYANDKESFEAASPNGVWFHVSKAADWDLVRRASDVRKSA